jgi:DNA-binding MarR family transcriptional regulator
MDGVDKTIKQWAKQIPDLNTTPMGLTARLQQVTKLVNEELNTTFKTYKLSDASFDVLATLLRAGPPHSLSPGQLLKQMLITSGTMTTRIDKLEKKGFVKRKSKKEDKRSVSVALTKKGLTLIEEVIVEHVKAQQRIVSVFDEKEQKVFTSLLQKYLINAKK